MLRSRSALLVAVLLFVTVEVTLGVLLQVTPTPVCWHFSFLAVVLACAFCLLLAARTPAYALTQIALALTVFSDSILVYGRTGYTVLAMCAFSLVQLVYGVRILLAVGRYRGLQLAVRGGISVIAVLAVGVVVGGAADALAYISLFYFANLLVNAVFAWTVGDRPPLLAIGLLLFVLCDIFVGFSMLSEYLPLPDTPLVAFLASPPINMAWVFYLPCQVLLSLSLLPAKWRALGNE